MDRYSFLADLLAVASDCIENADNGCPYDVFVSPGEPPADCSHIAAYWNGSTMLGGSEKCLMKVRENFTISMNRCCLKNLGEDFDPILEDEDARCFIKDFETMLECVMCNIYEVLKDYVRTGQEVAVSGGMLDRAASGGCYGATIEIAFTRHHSCC
jgi:hypothetical protein